MVGKEPFNILITAASRRVAMISGFRAALDGLGIAGKVICTDTDPLSASLQFCDASHIVPLSSSDDYIPEILDICGKENIRLIVPTIDEELGLFGKRKPDFISRGVIPLVSSADAGAICRDKLLTARFFREHNFPFARTYLPSQIDYGNVKYPLFIKPRMGRGSVGAYPIRNENELRFFAGYVANPIVQRYLEGKEYTVDVLVSLDKQVLSIVPRQRLVIRAGVCDRGRTEKNTELIELCRQICEKLGVVGPVNLQCKIDNGRISFFEINPRFSGAIQLTVAAGADFFSMIIRDALGERLAPVIGQFTDKLVMSSYEASVFQQGNGHAGITNAG